MTKETDSKDAARDNYANILQGHGFSPTAADMVAEAVAHHPGRERRALENLGVSPAMVNATLEALGMLRYAD